MNVSGMPVGPLQATCWILDDGHDAIVIDPGGDGAAIHSRLRGDGLTLREIWLTHAHFDHVGGLADLLDALDPRVPVRMHAADRPWLEAADEAAAAWGITVRPPPMETEDLHDGEVLGFAGADVHCLHTPGHAPGHVSFWIPSAALVVAGDALFRGSIGRTDLPLSDTDQLIASIREKLLTLPPETAVLPGHGPRTDVRTEARTNPFLA